MGKHSADKKQEPLLVSTARKTGAVARGVGAGVLVLWQEHFLFPANRRTPGENGLDPVGNPEDYPQLKGKGIAEKQLIDPATGNQPITIYERMPDPGKPTFVLFHGQAGHWFDGGPASLERYPDENIGRTNGLQYLQAAAESGAGIIAVSLPGYGKTPGEPGEQSFNHAITAVANHVIKEFDAKQTSPDRIIAGGESLGCASALEFAAQMNERGFGIAQVDMMNPFSSLAEVSSEALKTDPNLRKAPTLSAEFLNEHLKHHFDNRAKLARLNKATGVLIGTSTKDSKIDHHHSDDLVKLAGTGDPEKGIAGLGLDVRQSLFEECNHRNWSPPRLLAKSLRFYNERQGRAEDKDVLARLETHDYTFKRPEPAKGWTDKIRTMAGRRSSPDSLTPAA